MNGRRTHDVVPATTVAPQRIMQLPPPRRCGGSSTPQMPSRASTASCAPRCAAVVTSRMTKPPPSWCSWCCVRSAASGRCRHANGPPPKRSSPSCSVSGSTQSRGFSATGPPHNIPDRSGDSNARSASVDPDAARPRRTHDGDAEQESAQTLGLLNMAELRAAIAAAREAMAAADSRADAAQARLLKAQQHAETCSAELAAFTDLDEQMKALHVETLRSTDYRPKVDVPDELRQRVAEREQARIACDAATGAIEVFSREAEHTRQKAHQTDRTPRRRQAWLLRQPRTTRRPSGLPAPPAMAQTASRS
jgi:hypothetical protein